MANQTIQNSIDFASTQIQYSPLSVGTANEPAITIANEIQNLFFGPPFTWGFNRAENGPANNTTLTLQPGVQDYLVPVTDFSFMETATTTDPVTGETFSISDVYNTKNLSTGDTSPNISKRGRPNSVSVRMLQFGTSITLRFLGVPDKAYGVTFTYQKLVAPMSALTGAAGTWTIPAHYSDIYTALFLAEAFATVDDARAMQYRQRGIAALLAKAEGLNEMQINSFLQQYWSRQGRPEVAGPLRTQQATQGRGV
jgi:hypothetical protein